MPLPFTCIKRFCATLSANKSHLEFDIPVLVPGSPSDLNTGNRIEGATGCPSWCRPLRPLFHFLCSNLKANPVYGIFFLPFLELGAESRRGRLEAHPLGIIVEADPCEWPRRNGVVGPLGLDLDGLELPVQAEHGAEAGLHDPLLRFQFHNSSLLVLKAGEKPNIGTFAPEN